MRGALLRSVVRVTASATTLATVSLSIAACRDIVSPETVDLAAELCDLLVNCQGLDSWQCPTQLEQRVDIPLPGDEDPSQVLLTLDSAVDCLASCTTARICRDQPPICRPSGELGCAEGADCCGFTGGVADCVSGACCIADGAPCQPGQLCCSGACDADGYCGDVVCALVGDACAANFDCCSRRCDSDGLCEANLCAGRDEACVTDTDCCPLLGPGGELVPAQCAQGGDGKLVCRRDPDVCTGCDPLDPQNCCVTELDQFCYVVGDQLTQCGSAECPPAGAECGSNDDCCEGLLCDTGFIPHCAACLGPGTPCVPGETSCCGELVCGNVSRCVLP